jgi:bacteriocin-like protein
VLTVYSKNNCPNCVKLKNQLDSWNVEYEEINIEQNTDAKSFVVDQGHRSVPILYNGIEHIKHEGLTKNMLQQIIGGF